MVFARQDKLWPDYVCCVEATAKAQPPCQRIPGGGVDAAIGQLLVQSVTALVLEVALNVQSEIQSRLTQAERFFRTKLLFGATPPSAEHRKTAHTNYNYHHGGRFRN